MVKIKGLVFSFLMMSMVNTAVFAQQDKQIAVDSLNKYIKPIASGVDSVRDYSAVIDLLKNKALVGLGESTHGTGSIFEGKSEIIKRLIKQGDFKTVFMETGYCGLLNIDTLFRQSKQIDLLKGFKKSGLFGIYKTDEVYRMFEWIAAYNQEHDLKDRVAILGIDMQDAEGIADKLVQILPDGGKNDQKIHNGLITIKNGFTRTGAFGFSKAEQVILKEMVSGLTSLALKQSDPEFTFITRLMEQSVIWLNSSAQLRSDIRDQYMAENVLWLKKNRRENGKAIVWAHNAHLANSKRPYRLPMGSHLKKELKNDYYNLAFAFDEGWVRIFDPKSTKPGFQERLFASSENVNSIEYYFKDCKPKDFLLDLTEIADNKFFKQFFRKNNRLRVIGSRFLGDGNFSFTPESILDGYDGFVFFNKASAAKELRR
ncbi:erythromycin esterase family protein [Pedobacter caeni]|uniref:Erythromycin esterase homolog n=1 Tax=Pedobacter caeni TaxID=288992 RepID=A0A1M5BKN3_9SPHI|nr:erythromycin esterase family protein [Pedobacter caeni]SHF43028.1 Erythromycin esterase homolog [Pedobacter caeni]